MRLSGMVSRTVRVPDRMRSAVTLATTRTQSVSVREPQRVVINQCAKGLERACCHEGIDPNGPVEHAHHPGTHVKRERYTVWDIKQQRWIPQSRTQKRLQRRNESTLIVNKIKAASELELHV